MSILDAHQVIMASSLVEKVQQVAQSHNEEVQKNLARKQQLEDKHKVHSVNDLKNERKVENRQDREKEREHRGGARESKADKENQGQPGDEQDDQVRHIHVTV